MQKIISLFKRNYDGDRLVYDSVVEGAEWVINGEGVATRKWDGTCCLLKDGNLYKRYDAKNGKIPSDGFIPAQDPDPNTGHWPGWLLVGDTKEDARHREGFKNLFDKESEGTYELCGPKVGKNPEGFERHVLIKHGCQSFMSQPPRDFNGLKEWFKGKDIEGIVWWHEDGRMVKIKKKDFGLKRGD